MNIETTPSRKPIPEVSISITSALFLAVLEWFLMLMLYVDASFSYLVTRFARRFQLQVPCLLCSRLDHVLGNERTEFYWDLICQDHKINISSLILRDNLEDLRSTCQSCFRSSKFEDPSYDEADSIARRSVCCNKQVVLHPSKLTEVDAMSLNSRCNRDDVSEIDKGLSREENPIRSVDESREVAVEQHPRVEQRDKMNSEKLSNSEMSLNAIETTGLKQKGCNNEGGETSGFEFERKHQTDSKPIETEPRSYKPDLLDLSDAYKVAVGARLRQLSGKLLEQQKSTSESTKASEDLKLLLSQLSSSAARGFELPPNSVSPRMSMNGEDDASAFQLLQRRISLERNESNLSLDGSTVSEIEGENPVDRLKRQVEHDKKVLSCLYKELEEERNASSVAASQAMAMITRLQEEKAALRTEALQCLRMMEEQAEYDCDALQKANDLLLEREKQVRDFESELETYRKIGTTALDYDEVDKIGGSKQFVIQHLKRLEQKLSMISKDEPGQSAECFSEEKTDERGKFSKRDETVTVLRHELSTVIKRLEATKSS